MDQNQQKKAQDIAGQATEYVKRVGMMTSDADKELWGLVSDVPRLSGAWPYICAVLNVFLAGTGTMLAGCLAEGSWSKTQIIWGFIQLLTAVWLVGYALSIYWAYLIVKKALKDKQEVQKFLQDT